MADKTIAASFDDAEAAISGFIREMGGRYHFLEKLPGAGILKGSQIRSHKEVSDRYLCELAAKNDGQLATLDIGIKHPKAVFIA